MKNSFEGSKEFVESQEVYEKAKGSECLDKVCTSLEIMYIMLHHVIVAV